MAVVLMAAEREIVVRLTPDPTDLVAWLDRASVALRTAADELRPPSPVPSPPIADDTDAPEPWTPKVGDRVTTHLSRISAVFDGAPGLVVGLDAPYVVVDLDAHPDIARRRGWHCLPSEVEPEQPATVGPEPLRSSLTNILPLWYAGEVANHVRDRLAQYPADTPALQVYADWFGAR